MPVSGDRLPDGTRRGYPPAEETPQFREVSSPMKEQVVERACVGPLRPELIGDQSELDLDVGEVFLKVGQEVIEVLIAGSLGVVL